MNCKKAWEELKEWIGNISYEDAADLILLNSILIKMDQLESVMDHG